MKIFLGSTFSDLVEYRARVREAIDRLRLQGHDVQWIGMEAFSAADQTPLEECLRYVNQADVYVGIFGVRYGSKIPGSDVSFTEAEFRRVVERGSVPLLLFLIDEDNANVKPKDFERDPKSLERLTALKKEIGDKWKVDYFKSPEDLASKVLTALARHLPATTTTATRPDLATTRGQYAAHLVDAFDKIDATRIAASLDRTLERIALTDVYVPLKASVAIPERDVYAREAMVAGRRLNDEQAAREQERLATMPLHDALAKFPGLVILGDPGSGKSTFLKYAAIAFVRSDQAARLGFAKPYLPIFITIAAYAERLREDHHQIPLAEYFAEYYRDVRGIAGDLAPLFKDALAKGQAIVLLDGLDEVKDIAERVRVAKQVENFWNVHRAAGNRLVITSRIIGYEKLGAKELTHLTLHDFDDDAIKLFLDQWCPVIERAAESDATTAARNAERERRELKDAIFRGTSGVRELAANTLLLTLLALIKRKGVRLPEQRVELYEEYIKALVENWALHRNPDRIITHTPKYSETERVLAALALWMRETNPNGVTNEIWKATIEELRTMMQGLSVPIRARTAAGETLDALGWLPPDLDAFVHISAGETTFNGKRVRVPEFCIAKYPVTYAQYQKFIDAGGYTTERYWKNQCSMDENERVNNLKDEAWKWLRKNGGAKRQPLSWDNPRFHRPGYPVIGVTWYEASAYCAWLTERFQIENPVGPNQESEIENRKFIARLPTEVEWVRAAGGEQSRRYVWNAEQESQIANQKSETENILAYANVKEGGLKGTTPVAMYPDGARVTETGEMIFDLAGNVWEWASNTFEEGYLGAYLRGGAWFWKAKDSHVASCTASNRYRCYRTFGFRVFAQ